MVPEQNHRTSPPLGLQHDLLAQNRLVGLLVVQLPELGVDVQLVRAGPAPHVVVRHLPRRVTVRTAIPPLLRLLRNLHSGNLHANLSSHRAVLNEVR